MAPATGDAQTKHELILQHIEQLNAGSKISVRKIARMMEVSDGTAYRAIKEAENQGLVATRERIGTVRIEKKPRAHIDNLTFDEVAAIVDGRVLGGEAGLHKPLNKFVIGAMQLDEMMQYIEAGSLLIVGNRDEAHIRALEHGAGVLITGGFNTADEVKSLADRIELPIISSDYDSFTVASMINRAIYDRLIKNKVVLVEDIVSDKKEVHVLKSGSTIHDWQRLYKLSGESRFPVVDEWNRVIGMITSSDLVEARADQTLDKFMTRRPLTVDMKTSIAAAAHLMVWEGIQSLPVVAEGRKMMGVISRKEAIQAMQYSGRQPLLGETFEDLIWMGFEEVRDEQGRISYKGKVTPQMTNQHGTVSEGVLTGIMTRAAFGMIKEYRKNDLVLENMSSYFLRPVQIDREITVLPETIEISRKFCKIDVVIRHADSIVSKAMLTAQIIDQE